MVKTASKRKIKKPSNRLTIQPLVFFCLFVALFAYLLLNIFYSQTVSPLYVKVVNEDRGATGKFLSKIKPLPDFSRLLEMNKNIYGRDLEQTVFFQEEKIRQEIARLEDVLIKNPKARGVLLRLSVLYDELGNKIKAEEYLNKAREIDPEINIKY